MDYSWALCVLRVAWSLRSRLLLDRGFVAYRLATMRGWKRVELNQWPTMSFNSRWAQAYKKTAAKEVFCSESEFFVQS